MEMLVSRENRTNVIKWKLKPKKDNSPINFMSKALSVVENVKSQSLPASLTL
jgi:hypothetical protein